MTLRATTLPGSAESTGLVRVLLVDDDEDDYRLTRSMLDEITRPRFEVDWVPHYDDALAVAARHEHDIFLVDYRLGARTGLELLSELKTRHPHAPPVILLTGQGEAEIDRAALQAGAADYLEKSRLDATLLERMIRYALRQHDQERVLEQKIADRTAKLEAANAALAEVARRKDEFIATLAHELRNPLAPIRNALEIQRMVIGDAEATEQARGMIERQVHQLVRLIDDLLDASRLTRGKLRLDLRPLDLRDPLAVAIESARPLMERQQLNFRCQMSNEPMLLKGDRVRLAQVFTNLLNNACKYTPPQGFITLDAHPLDDEFEICISDTGAGLPAELLPSVFELFTQIDRTLNRSEGGLGIGLALVKSITELHGGRVKAESPGINRGSTFSLRLPRQPPVDDDGSQCEFQ